jgi:hypothetical protein
VTAGNGSIQFFKYTSTGGGRSGSGGSGGTPSTTAGSQVVQVVVEEIIL